MSPPGGERGGDWAAHASDLRTSAAAALARWRQRIELTGVPGGPSPLGDQPERTASEAQQLRVMAAQRGAAPLALVLERVERALRAGSGSALREALQALSALVGVGAGVSAPLPFEATVRIVAADAGTPPWRAPLPAAGAPPPARSPGGPQPAAPFSPTLHSAVSSPVGPAISARPEPRPGRPDPKIDPAASLREPAMLSRSMFAAPAPGSSLAPGELRAGPAPPSPAPMVLSVTPNRGPGVRPSSEPPPGALGARLPLSFDSPLPPRPEQPSPVGPVLGLRADFSGRSQSPVPPAAPVDGQRLGLGRRFTPPGMPRAPHESELPPRFEAPLGEETRRRRRPRTNESSLAAGARVPRWALVVGLAMLGLAAVTGYVIVSATRKPGDAVATQGPSASSGSTSGAPAMTAFSTGSPAQPPGQANLGAAAAPVPRTPGKESAELAALIDMQRRLAVVCQSDPTTCGGRWTPLARDALGTSGQAPIVVAHPSGGSLAPGWSHRLKVAADLPLYDEPTLKTMFDFSAYHDVGHQRFQTMLFDCAAYSDIFESALLKYGAPTWLRAVVFQESQCNPRAKSPVGALGLWQFMPESGRAYGLRVDEQVDERLNPLKETDAAMHFLVDLHRALGAWDLVLAAYNMGPYAVLVQLNRAPAGTGFWDLVHAGVLPEETSGYVPGIEAYALVMQNLMALHFTSDGKRLEATAQIAIRPGTRLSQIARAASTSTSHLHDLNPEFLVDTIPDGETFVRVPDAEAARAQAFLAQVAPTDERDRCVPDTFDWGATRFEASPYAKNCRFAH